MKDRKTYNRGIQIFQYFIEFLKIWGAENYGENTEVDWVKAYEVSQQFEITDFNEDLETAVDADTDEEFRNLTFSWIENQVYKGFPIWRLFKTSEWLRNKLEEEMFSNDIKEAYKDYKKNKCYRCKYFNSRSSFYHNQNRDFLDSKMVESGMYSLSSDYDKWNGEPLMVIYDCNKRKELLKEAISNSKNKFRMGNPKLSYRGFNVSNEEPSSCRDSWKCNPSKLNRCPYFEEDTDNNTLEDFMFKHFGFKKGEMDYEKLKTL